jgi:hypothetical protein
MTAAHYALPAAVESCVVAIMCLILAMYVAQVRWW